MRGYTALALHLSKLKGSPIENLRSREGMRVYVVYTEAQTTSTQAHNNWNGRKSTRFNGWKPLKRKPVVIMNSDTFLLRIMLCVLSNRKSILINENPSNVEATTASLNSLRIQQPLEEHSTPQVALTRESAVAIAEAA